MRKRELLQALLNERREAERRERELLDTILRLSNRGSLFPPVFEEPEEEELDQPGYSALDEIDGA